MRINKLLAIMMLLAVATGAYANVYVVWQASAGFYWEGTPGSGILGSGESTIAQLIWSADAVADGADFNAPGYVTGDDVVLATTTLTNNGGLYEDYAFFTGLDFNDNGAQPAGGYIYGRIFEDNTPALNEWYYVGEITAASNLNPGNVPPDSPQLYNINRNTVDGDAINNEVFGAQVVPEPASLSLLALGMAIVGIRRKRS